MASQNPPYFQIFRRTTIKYIGCATNLMHMNIVSYQILILFLCVCVCVSHAILGMVDAIQSYICFTHKQSPMNIHQKSTGIHFCVCMCETNTVCVLACYAARSFETEAGDGNQKLIKEKLNPQCKMDSELETTSLRLWDGFTQIHRMWLRALLYISMRSHSAKLLLQQRAEFTVEYILWHKSIYYRITIYNFYGYWCSARAKTGNTHSVR